MINSVIAHLSELFALDILGSLAHQDDRLLTKGLSIV
jgi:hypothetical protein